MLDHASEMQPARKIFLPGNCITLLQPFPFSIFFYVPKNNIDSQFGCVNGHCHAVTAKRSNHAGSITHHKHVVKNWFFRGKRNLIDYFRFFKQKCGVGMYAFDQRILKKHIFFQCRYATIFLQPVAMDQITKIGFAGLNVADTQIAPVEIMKSNQIIGVVGFDMVLNANIG